MAQPPNELRPKSRSLPNAPTDGITCLTYLSTKTNSLTSSSKTSSLLASTSWDGSVRIHDTKKETLVCSHAMESGPLLSLAPSCPASGGEGEKMQGSNFLFTGGLDGSIKQFDIEKSTTTVVGHHSPEKLNEEWDGKANFACSCLSAVWFGSSPISDFSSSPILASAGWDSRFHVWDIRSCHKPAVRIDLLDKAFSMDVDLSRGNRFVISTAKRETCIIDVRMNQVVPHGGDGILEAEVILKRESSLKYQTRVSRFFPDGTGIAVGSIEGRVAIEFLDEIGVNSAGKKKYAFKCHRAGDVVYPVNAIAFHPLHGTFATGGCDGSVVTWDGLNKKKICTLPKFPTSIAALAFNHDGSELAIASSYTFEEGERDHPKDEIYVRTILDSECKPKCMK